MNLCHQLKKEVLVIQLAGSFDITSIQKFNDYVSQNIKKEKNVGIDFENVDFCDSSAIGSIVNLLTKLRQKDCKLYIFSLNENVRQSFDTAKLGSFLDIISKREFYRMFPENDFLRLK